MGWTSTGDPYANVGDAGLSFDSKEAAVEFAQRHGWEYTVTPISILYKSSQFYYLSGKNSSLTYCLFWIELMYSFKWFQIWVVWTSL